MLSSDEQENDEFFDSKDCFSSDQDLCCEKLSYGIWINEPASVKERRGNFLREMGRVLFADLDEVVEWNRITECSHAVSCSSKEEIFVCGRDLNSEATGMVDEFEHDEEIKQNSNAELPDAGICRCTDDFKRTETDDFKRRELKDSFGETVNGKIEKKWWKRVLGFKKEEISRSTPKTKQINVKQKKKKCQELTAVFTRQEIKAHEGSILTMKFSQDGQYLATGGEDGVVCIWRVTSTEVSYESFLSKDDCKRNVNESKHFDGKKPCHASVIFPEKVCHINDMPVHKFQDHRSDVLDLAWSSSNFLLSCSKDATVRLWQVGCDHCLHVFQHRNYVTCVQFNPMNDKYFISGSIDGKIRIWGVSCKRVVDWAHVRDVITAVCYQPDGNGIAVGTITGKCRFYEASGNLELEAVIKTKSKRITGIQFSQENSRRVMISTEVSKLRILDLDSLDCVFKFKALPKSRCQMSANFTSREKHIISVGEDSRVYVWNYDNSSPKSGKSVQACEHFFSEGVTVAVSIQSAETKVNQESVLWNRDRDSGRFSIGSWFSSDVPSRGSATWPEETLPFLDLTREEVYQKDHQEYHQNKHPNHYVCTPDLWGLVIVTGGCDGIIRTFHNYGLPVRLQ
ncbi:hypothetical protein ACFE04_017846 [Oxalis oulophora]